MDEICLAKTNNRTSCDGTPYDESGVTCRRRNCFCCGFEAREARFRKRLIDDNCFTVGEDGLKRLAIPYRDSYEEWSYD